MRAGIPYARELGWAIVPLHDVSAGFCSCPEGRACKSAGKHPRLKDWTAEATSDVEQITAWSRAWPSANVGVATGAPSGFFVLDVDPEKGGFESLKLLTEQFGSLPRTTLSTTGSAGNHYLFQLPAGVDLANTAGRLGPGLDTRGTGGQIVLPPSRSSKGPYTWLHNPFQVPIAVPPEWLLKLLITTPAGTARPTPEDRGYFPPASAEILDQARAALAKHGPAVDGQGGGLHTVQAAAIVSHDFALTDDEAWPLLCAWNQTCQPPWELEGANSLRVMLGRGRKYGKAQYGAKRSLDVETRLRKLIADSVGGDTMKLVEAARPLFEQAGDRARHALMARELEGATGLRAKALDLPAPTVDRDPAPVGTIEVTVKLHEVADQAARAIAEDVFTRGGLLCEVARAERVTISDLEVPRIVDLMSRRAVWARREADGGLVSTVPPENVARILGARRAHAGVRVIEAVTTAPVFLADGSILQERGYSEQARLWLEPSVEVVVPEAPTRDDARKAIVAFLDIIRDFEFLENADKIAWIAGVLSPLVKSAISNAPVPLICVSAAAPGAGKSMLANLASRIVTGTSAEIRPYNPRDLSEWGKRLTAYVKAAAPISVFDNVNGPFGDENLDRLITSLVWSDRILGGSDAPPLPVSSTWWATGNNIEPQGDTVRRCLFVRLDVTHERPQERGGFKYPDLEGHVLQYRAHYLTQALTILRAYHVAGRPAQQLPTWGSFDAWSALVRGALVWAGAVDPMVTQKRAAAQLLEPDNEVHDFWLAVIDGSEGTATDVAARANQRDACSVLGIRDPVTAHSLRKFVNRFVDKPRTGLRIRRDGHVYRVEKIRAA